MRVAVLSDQHIDTRFDPESWTLARAAFRAVDAARIDHLVLAGDTFDCSTAMRRDRARVRTFLRRLGLWHRDRLTIVPGNHDLFHTPHHGTPLARAREMVRIARRDAQLSFDIFCEWVDDLIAPRDRLDPAMPFPHVKRLGPLELWATDTVSRETVYAGNGYWYEESDDLLRAHAAALAGGRRVVAMHHPPFEDEQHRIGLKTLRRQFPFGFPAPDFERLRRFVGDTRAEAILCGHVHQTGGTPYTWPVGQTVAYLMGRSGRVNVERSLFGLLEVPRQGPLVWSERPVLRVRQRLVQRPSVPPATDWHT